MTRKSIITQIERTAAGLKTLKLKVNENTWNLAELFVALRETFPQGKDNTAAFKATAATAANCTEGYVENLTRAVEVRKDLTGKQRERVADWSVDAVLTLGNLDGSKRNSLITKVEKAGTQNVKVIRDLKREVTGKGKSSRTRKGKTSQNVALMERLSDRFAELAAEYDVLALIAGAQLAQDNEGDVAAALVLWNAQVREPATVV